AVRLRGVRRRLLVADVDYPDPLLHTAVQDRDDVTSGQREDGVDALPFEGAGYECSTVDLRHAPTLTGRGEIRRRARSSPSADGARCGAVRGCHRCTGSRG